MKVQPMTREQLLGLPPVIDLTTLGRAFGVSEPVARERHRQGEFERIGIRVVRLGAQWRVVTADLLHVLGVTRESRERPPIAGVATGLTAETVARRNSLMKFTSGESSDAHRD